MSRSLSKKEAHAQQLQQQQQQQYARDTETREHHTSANASVRPSSLFQSTLLYLAFIASVILVQAFD